MAALHPFRLKQKSWMIEVNEETKLILCPLLCATSAVHAVVYAHVDITVAWFAVKRATEWSRVTVSTKIRSVVELGTATPKLPSCRMHDSASVAGPSYNGVINVRTRP